MAGPPPSSQPRVSEAPPLSAADSSTHRDDHALVSEWLASLPPSEQGSGDGNNGDTVNSNDPQPQRPHINLELQQQDGEGPNRVRIADLEEEPIAIIINQPEAGTGLNGNTILQQQHQQLQRQQLMPPPLLLQMGQNTTRRQTRLMLKNNDSRSEASDEGDVIPDMNSLPELSPDKSDDSDLESSVTASASRGGAFSQSTGNASSSRFGLSQASDRYVVSASGSQNSSNRNNRGLRQARRASGVPAAFSGRINRQTTANTSTSPIVQQQNTRATPRQEQPSSSARFFQQIQSSRRVTATNENENNNSGLHSRKTSQTSFASSGGSPPSENQPVVNTNTRRSNRKRAVSDGDNKNQNGDNTNNGPATPIKRRKVENEMIDTILAAVTISNNRSRRGENMLQVCLKDTGKVKVMQESEVKKLAPRVYKAWKQLQ